MAYLNPRSAASKILSPGWSLGYGAKERTRRKNLSREGRDGAGSRKRRGKIADTHDYGPHIFTHDGGRFDNCQKMGKGYGVLLDMSFSLFPQKNMDREGIWGTLGDALRHVSLAIPSIVVGNPRFDPYFKVWPFTILYQNSLLIIY